MSSEADKLWDRLFWTMTTASPTFNTDYREALDAYIDARIAEKMKEQTCGHTWIRSEVNGSIVCSKCGAGPHDENDE